MDSKEFAAFAETVGLFILRQQTQIEAANARLDALGEPTITVEAPTVTVAGAEVIVDLETIVGALQAISGEGIEKSLGVIAGVLETMEPTTEVAVTAPEIVAALEGMEAVDISQLIAIAQAFLDGQAPLEAAMREGLEQAHKTEAAVQSMFTAILEQIQTGQVELLKALSAPKRLIEENGVLVGVETLVN